MKRFYRSLVLFSMAICVFSGNTWASLLIEDEQTFPDKGAFSRANFIVQPLHKLEKESDNKLVGKISAFSGENTGFNDVHKNIYLVTDYEKAPSKTALNYGPPKTDEFDTVILSRYRDDPQSVSSSPSQLYGVLEDWKAKGYSSHAILPTNGGLVLWIDPTESKGQMAGKWNKHSVEVLAGTGESQELLPHQISSLSFLIHFMRSEKNDIQYCLTHSEAQGSGKEGKISNINEVRKELGLRKDNEEQAQIPVVSQIAQNNTGASGFNCSIL